MSLYATIRYDMVRYGAVRYQIALTTGKGDYNCVKIKIIRVGQVFGKIFGFCFELTRSIAKSPKKIPNKQNI